MVSTKNAFQSAVNESRNGSPSLRKGTPSLLARHLSEDSGVSPGTTSPRLQPEPPPGPSPTSRSSSAVDTQAVERVVARLLAAHSTEMMQAIGDVQAAQTALIEKVEALSRSSELPT